MIKFKEMIDIEEGTFTIDFNKEKAQKNYRTAREFLEKARQKIALSPTGNDKKLFKIIQKTHKSLMDTNKLMLSVIQGLDNVKE